MVPGSSQRLKLPLPANLSMDQDDEHFTLATKRARSASMKEGMYKETMRPSLLAQLSQNTPPSSLMLEILPKQLPQYTVGHRPNYVDGHRTPFTCELCGFEPKTINIYREKQDHLVMKHFKEKIDKILPHCRPYTCPTHECDFTGKDKQALQRHYTGKHGILEKMLQEELAAQSLPYDRGQFFVFFYDFSKTLPWKEGDLKKKLFLY